MAAADKWRSWIGALSTLLGIGAGVLALGYTQGFPDPWLLFCRIAGWILFVAAIAGLLGLGLSFMLAQKRLSSRPLESWYFRRFGKYRIRAANVNDLAALVALADTFIEGGASPNFRQRLEARPDTATIIEIPSEGNRIVGFYILLPLNLRTTRNIQRGVVRSGSQLVEEDFVKSISRARSVYIGGLYGRTTPDRAFTTIALDIELRRALVSHRSIEAVYAKPSTEESRRLRHRYGLKPLFSRDEIWELSRARAVDLGIFSAIGSSS